MMKTFSLAPMLALAGLSLAQLQGLPTCAQSCANLFLTSGIGNCNRDIPCICADKGFISAISCCLIEQCDASDQQKAIDFAQQLCQANQVSVPNSVICTASLSTTFGVTGSAAPVTTTTTSTSGSPAETTSAASSTGSGGSTTGASTTGGGGPATPAPSTTASAAGNAGPRQTAAPVLGALGGIVAFAALL